MFANQIGRTVDGLRLIVMGVLLPGAAALTACGGGSSSVNGAGIEAGPGAVSGPAPTVPARPLQVLFAGDNRNTGTELFLTDGTAAGMVMVKDIRPGTGNRGVSLLTVVGSMLYFVAMDDVSGAELWKSDGKGSSTVMVKDIFPGANNGIDLNGSKSTSCDWVPNRSRRYLFNSCSRPCKLV